MQWVEKEAGKWTHPSYGAIEQIEDGRWRSVNPAGEVIDPLDGDTSSLEASQRYQEAIWAGWKPCGDRMWEHSRYGTICKTEHGEWFGRMSAPASVSDRNDPYVLGAGWKGPYERSGWAKKELWRLWPLTHAAKIVSRAEDAALYLFAALAAIGIIDPVVIAVLSLGAFLAALVTDNRTAWASMHRDLVDESLIRDRLYRVPQVPVGVRTRHSGGRRAPKATWEERHQSRHRYPGDTGCPSCPGATR